jgi:hypothetical protein
MYQCTAGSQYFLCSTVLVPGAISIKRYYHISGLDNRDRRNRWNRQFYLIDLSFPERHYHTRHLVFLFGYGYFAQRYAYQYLCGH